MKNQNLEAFSEPRAALVVKWKQSGKVNFFRKKSENTVWCSFWFWVEWWYFRHSSAIWWWDIAIWKFVICATPTAYAKIFLGNFFVSIGRVKNSTCTGQVFINFHSYNNLEWFFEKIENFTFLLKMKILRRLYFFDWYNAYKNVDNQIKHWLIVHFSY